MCGTCWRLVPAALGALVYRHFHAGRKAGTHPNGAWMLAADAAIALVMIKTRAECAHLRSLDTVRVLMRAREPAAPEMSPAMFTLLAHGLIGWSVATDTEGPAVQNKVLLTPAGRELVEKPLKFLGRAMAYAIDHDGDVRAQRAAEEIIVASPDEMAPLLRTAWP